MKANMLAARTFLTFIEECNNNPVRYMPLGKRYRFPKNDVLPPMWEADFLVDRYPSKAVVVRIIMKLANYQSSQPSVQVMEGEDIVFFKRFE